MRTMGRAVTGALALVVILGGGIQYAGAADASDMHRATKQVESGAKQTGKGIEDLAKGVGNTVVEGAKIAGEKIQDTGKAAAPKAKEVGKDIEQGTTSFFTGVKSFFGRLFGKE